MTPPRPHVERRTVRTVRVELPRRRVLKVGVWPGEPGEVVIRVPPEAPPGGRTEDSMSLPVDFLTALLRALAALDSEEEP